MLTKLCLTCGKEFTKPYSTGLPEWETRRFCSKSCTHKGKPSWNKGKKTGLIPKTAFRKGERRSMETEFKKGLVPWNKKNKKICLHCGENKVNNHRADYCSFICRGAATKKERPSKDCSVCGIKFYRRYSYSDKRWKDARYCSRKCQFDGQGIHFKGEKNKKWKGGITPLMNQIRGLREYRKWIIDIFHRDNYTCKLCGARNGNGKKIILNADHFPVAFSTIIKEEQINTVEKALSSQKLWDTSNGRTLCVQCHKQETAKQRKLL